MSERKFKIGDVVKPIKTDPDSHNFEEWEILKITRVSDGDPNLFECTRESDGEWDLLWGFELELVEGDCREVKRELRVGDRVIMVRFDRMPYPNDKIGNTGEVMANGGGLIDVKVDSVNCDCENGCDGDCDVFPYFKEDEPWELLEENEDKTYTHEEVAEILGIEKDQVETIAVDISDKPFEDKEVDMVNHPPHYANKEPETIKMIEAILPPLEFIGGLKWQILKYRDRAGDKWDKEEDLKKAKFYYDYLEDYKARKGIE